MSNRRDIHGDGHGFVDVPIGRPAQPKPKWNFEIERMPLNTDHPFVGLYVGPDQVKEARLVRRAPFKHRGLRLLSYENNHYMTDPLAWAEIPTW